jgi:large subunit ribosomal protein L30
MKKYRITQIKSGIDRTERQKKNLIALGLNKLHRTVELEATPQIEGMLNKVKHLLKIEQI